LSDQDAFKCLGLIFLIILEKSDDPDLPKDLKSWCRLMINKANRYKQRLERRKNLTFKLSFSSSNPVRKKSCQIILPLAIKLPKYTEPNR
jgi:hypothetical protein